MINSLLITLTNRQERFITITVINFILENMKKGNKAEMKSS